MQSGEVETFTPSERVWSPPHDLAAGTVILSNDQMFAWLGAENFATKIDRDHPRNRSVASMSSCRIPGSL